MKMCSVSLTACILSVTLHMYQYLHIYLQKHHKLTRDLQFSSLLLLRCILLFLSELSPDENAFLWKDFCIYIQKYMENSNGVCLSGELKMSSGIRTLMNTEVLYDMSALPFLCIFRPDIPLTLTSYNFRTNLPFPIISSSVLQHP